MMWVWVRGSHPFSKRLSKRLCFWEHCAAQYTHFLISCAVFVRMATTISTVAHAGRWTHFCFLCYGVYILNAVMFTHVLIQMMRTDVYRYGIELMITFWPFVGLPYPNGTAVSTHWDEFNSKGCVINYIIPLLCDRFLLLTHRFFSLASNTTLRKRRTQIRPITRAHMFIIFSLAKISFFVARIFGIGIISVILGRALCTSHGVWARTLAGGFSERKNNQIHSVSHYFN